MKSIHDIENLQPEAIELLEAAGYTDAKNIFDHKISDITVELVKANKVLEIIDTEPTHALVAQWLNPIEKELDKTFQDDGPQIDPTSLIEPKDLLNTPFAIPISEDFIKKHNVEIAKLPAGSTCFLNKEQAIQHFHNEGPTPVNYNLVANQPDKKSTQKEEPSIFDDPVFADKDPKILDKSRILNMDTFRKEGSSVPAIERGQEANLTKTTKKETNVGVDPDSRFYIKGVLHKSVSRFKSGCRSFILVNILILLSFIITPLVILDRELYWWAVWTPLLALLAFIIYFSTAQRASCPICNQKQFAPKRCLKHKQAHRWPFFGYMLPTAIHALLFKWFRCIFCGTSIRLKE